jgi:hypothetical protein
MKNEKRPNWFWSMFINSDNRFSSCVFIGFMMSMVRTSVCLYWMVGKEPKPGYVFEFLKDDSWIIGISLFLQKLENIIFHVKNTQVKYKDFEINTNNTNNQREEKNERQNS